MSASNKRSKGGSSWEGEFDSVRDCLTSHALGTEHPAIASALKGLEQERKRLERDHKLKLKFTAASDSKSSSRTSMVGGGGGDHGFSKIGNEPGVRELISSARLESSASKDESMSDDWQDVSPDQADSSAKESSSKSGLGATLAQGTVELLGQNNVLCATPLGAITAALHATLLQVGFVCTGVPTKETKSSNGFAAPVRQLSTFLPPRWEQPVGIRLRYRKKHAATLKVESCGTVERQLSIVFCENTMTMDIAEHFNLDSWERAQKPAPPSLHYKALGQLLTKFTSHFDLGLLEETDRRSTPAPMQVPCGLSETTGVARFHAPAHRAPQQQFPAHPTNVFPGQHPFGDFSGDVTPAGLVHPGSVGSGFLPPPHPGNLMGPDHPMFAGGPMQQQQQRFKPRFDPFGPPGGPMDPSNTNGPPGGTGNPNNDMAMPTRFDPNNMFT